MRHTIFSILLISSIAASAQLTHWSVKPQQDTIFVKTDGLLQSLDKGDNMLWTMEGKRLFVTDKHINPFNNGIATLANKDKEYVIGFVDKDGNFREIRESRAAHNYPHFEDGYLITKRQGKYEMHDKNGHIMPLPELEVVYPYSNGLATYLAYQQPEKQKNPYFNFLLSEGTPAKNFVVKEVGKDKNKIIEPKDISFLSTMDKGTGKSLAVIKNKLYWFDSFNFCFIPITIEDEKGKPKHLTIDNKKILEETSFPTDEFIIKAKTGKDQYMEFRFDPLLRLLPQNASSTYHTEKDKKEYEAPRMESNLTTFSESGRNGFIINGKDSIPSQFEQIGMTYGNRAFAKLNGKWGVIEILPNSTYEIKLNDGKDITFRHHTANGNISIALPTSIKADNVTLEVPENSGLHLAKDTRASSNSEQGNIVTYACTLDVPSELPDSLTDISYGKVALIVDQVRQSGREVKAKGLHQNHYNIQIPKAEADVIQGKAVFDLEVTNIKEEGENDYPVEMALLSENLKTGTEMLASNLFRCTVDSLRNGINDINVKVNEAGCPGVIFPIQVVYSVVRKKETATVRFKSDEAAADSPALAEAPISIDNSNVGGSGQAESSAVVPTIDPNIPIRIMSDNGYFYATVISENATIHSGPGENYPAPQYYDKYMEQMEDCYAPYKNQIIEVKEEGEWYTMKYYDKKEPVYISKNHVTLVESKPFVLNEITKPISYITVDEVYEGDEEEGIDPDFLSYLVDNITIYPSGLFIHYYETLQGGVIKTGTIKTGDPILKYEYIFDSNYEKTKAANHSILPQIGMVGVALNLKLKGAEIKNISKNTITKKTIEVSYPDLSKFSEAEWKRALKTAKASKYYNREVNDLKFNKNTDHFYTRDDLEKEFTKIK